MPSCFSELCSDCAQPLETISWRHRPFAGSLHIGVPAVYTLDPFPKLDTPVACACPACFQQLRAPVPMFSYARLPLRCTLAHGMHGSPGPRVQHLTFNIESVLITSPVEQMMKKGMEAAA